MHLLDCELLGVKSQFIGHCILNILHKLSVDQRLNGPFKSPVLCTIASYGYILRTDAFSLKTTGLKKISQATKQILYTNLCKYDESQVSNFKYSSSYTKQNVTGNRENLF